MDVDYLLKVISLAGQKAIVTGASSGIGRGIALSLANFGADVALLGRNKEGLELTQKMILERGGLCSSYIVDISKEDEVEAFFKTYKEEHKVVDIFVANAGFNVRAELLDTEMNDIKELLQTDYLGTLYGVTRAGKMMKEQRKGNIVIISSINGISAMANLAVYSSIKYALEGITRSLAASLGKYGVRVNSCAPGVILSKMNENIYSQQKNLEAKIEHIPLGKIGKPQDIGDVVACMVSDAFRFMTGTTVLVDGGELLRPMQRQVNEAGKD